MNENGEKATEVTVGAEQAEAAAAVVVETQTEKKGVRKSPKRDKPTVTFDEGKETGKILEIPIASIVRYENPRREPENLHNMGYTLFGSPAIEEVGEVEEDGPDKGKSYYVESGKRHVVDGKLPENKYISLLHMALDDDFADQYVELIETYEAVDRNKEPMADQSIIELAADISRLGQLVPILVRREKTGYAGIDGGRRCAAILYLHAKSKVLRAEKAKDAPKKVYPATVMATTDPCTQGEVFLHSLKANLSRKAFSPMQEGRVYHEMLQQINPHTGKKWTMKEAAEELNIEYGTFRNREALWRPYDSETKRGLTDSDREKVFKGEMGVTQAARKALGERHFTETRQVNQARRRTLPVSEIEKRFDQTDEKNVERRRAFAEVLGFEGEKGFKQACKESDERIAHQETVDVKKGNRNGKG